MPRHFSNRIFNYTAAHDSHFPGGLKLLNRKASGIARQKNPLHFIPEIHLPFARLDKIQINVPVPTGTTFREVYPAYPEYSLHSVTSGTAHKRKAFISFHSPCSHRPHFSTFNPYTCLYLPLI